MTTTADPRLGTELAGYRIESPYFRMLDWIALVGREGGQLRILDTQLT